MKSGCSASNGTALRICSPGFYGHALSLFPNENRNRQMHLLNSHHSDAFTIVSTVGIIGLNAIKLCTNNSCIFECVMNIANNVLII